MVKKIKKENIIHFNNQYIYFLQNKQVFRGQRKATHQSGLSFSRESSISLSVLEKSIKHIEYFCFSSDNSSQKTANILERYGVKIYRRHKT